MKRRDSAQQIGPRCKTQNRGRNVTFCRAIASSLSLSAWWPLVSHRLTYYIPAGNRAEVANQRSGVLGVPSPVSPWFRMADSWRLLVRSRIYDFNSTCLPDLLSVVVTLLKRAQSFRTHVSERIFSYFNIQRSMKKSTGDFGTCFGRHRTPMSTFGTPNAPTSMT